MGTGFTGDCSAVALVSLHAAVPGDVGSLEGAMSQAHGSLRNAVPRVLGSLEGAVLRAFCSLDRKSVV